MIRGSPPRMKMMGVMGGSESWPPAGFPPAVGAPTDSLRAMKRQTNSPPQTSQTIVTERIAAILGTKTIFRGAATEGSGMGDADTAPRHEIGRAHV